MGKQREIIKQRSILAQLQRAEAEKAATGLVGQKKDLEEKLKSEREKMKDSLEALEKHEASLKKETKELEVHINRTQHSTFYWLAHTL